MHILERLNVEILRRGYPAKDRKVKLTYRECRTVFVVTLQECNIVYDQRDGDYAAIACPVCKVLCTCAINLFKSPSSDDPDYPYDW